MNLFKYEDNKIVVDVELRLIPEFRKLIAKDKDRFKKDALKEFAFIYFMYDYKSPYAVYSEEERFERVKKECELEKEWKVDKTLQEAIDKYLELLETPTVKSLKSLRESLLTSSKVIDVLRKTIEKKVLQDEEIADDNIEEAVTLLDKLLKLGSSLPTTINSLQQLEEKVKAEQSLDKKIRGGGNVNFFEE